MKRSAIRLLLALAACHAQDWRAQAIAAAEDKIRIEVKDPNAEFSNVQLTGDQATGQSCGKVKVTNGRALFPSPKRFIVYIDNTAGPYIEGGLGSHPITDDDFSFQWHADCVAEGYHPPLLSGS
jgi:hypothetical protein